MSVTSPAASGSGAPAAGGVPGGTARVLVVGYGNPLRGDDGIGWHAAGRLACDPRLAAATVLQRRQLTPELAADLAEHDLAVLVDARVPAGDGEGLRVVELSPPGDHDAEPAPAGPGSWTHHVDARALLALTRQVYGSVPTTLLVTAPARSFELAPELLGDGVPDRLRPLVDQIVDQVVEQIEHAVEPVPPPSPTPPTA